MVAGEAEHLARRFRLLDAQLRERVGVGGRVARALVAARRDQHVHVGTRVRPCGERASRRDLGVVGVRVNGERGRRDFSFEHVSHQACPEP
jgi:hypothetical protein